VREGLGSDVTGLVGHAAVRSSMLRAAEQERKVEPDELRAMGAVLADDIRGSLAGLSTSPVETDAQ